MSRNNYLAEAFKSMNSNDILNEEAFTIDSKGADELKQFLDGEKVNDKVTLIDPDAKSIEELKSSYRGNLVLDCCICHTGIVKPKEEVYIEDGDDVANIEDICPFCSGMGGYKIVGEVKDDYDSDEDEKGEKDDEPKPEEKDEVEVEETEEDEKVEESVSAKRSARMKKKVRSLKEGKKLREGIDHTFYLEVVKKDGGKSDSDRTVYKGLKLDSVINAAKGEKLGGDEAFLISDAVTGKQVGPVPSAEQLEAEAKKIFEGKEITEAPNYELHPQYDSRKSFYGKARVDTGDKDDKNKLFSYDTLVAEIKDGKPVVYGAFSATTLRHIKDWLKQNGFKAENKAQILRDYGVKAEAKECKGKKCNIREGKRRKGECKRISEELLKEIEKIEKVDDKDVNSDTFKKAVSKIVGESISQITNFKIIHNISAFDDGVDSYIGCSFDGMVDDEWETFDYSDENNMFYQAWYEEEDDDYVATSDWGTMWFTDKSSEIIDAFLEDADDDRIFYIVEPVEGALYDYVPSPKEGEIEEGKKVNEAYYDTTRVLEIVSPRTRARLKRVIDTQKKYGNDMEISVMVDSPYRAHLNYGEGGADYRKDTDGKWKHDYGYIKVDSALADAIISDVCKAIGMCEKMNESVEEVKVTTETDEVNVKTEDGKVTVETQKREDEMNRDEEVIEPVSDEVKAEIEDDSAEAEIGDEIDVEMTDFDEESFDELGEAYLKKAYSNVESYKSVSATANDNRITVEGVIKFKSGNEKKTKFVLESKEVTRSGKSRFVGENLQIAKGKKAFTVFGTLSDGRFVTESLGYDYRAKDKNGKSKRISGTVTKR